MLSARVARKTGGFSPEFDHMILLVRMKDRWLADVGFGDSFTEMSLASNLSQFAFQKGQSMYSTNAEWKSDANR